ncbi:DUF4394 domain-containing protein [Hymenobacter cheonanensis]|uniref:DUF4394 domain-containing protein n=1 Tax=Hymenobacter sp. CA2-7 TaxID=3063993 RepID=UPI002714377C|nr:DUF4394 domain-containing protein [Hymenobacter sp. CA2-7]MDO7885462.1 DUF4394 domain-containing protein [Hymenobacter sp. CA2-7]
MSKLLTRWDMALKGLCLGALLLGAAARPAAAQTAYGITLDLTQTYSLVTFQVTAPGTFTATATITGLATGQSLVGIDSRPATGQIFALGYDATSTSNNAQLYTLSTAGVLTPVGSASTLLLGNNATRVGFDFNPTVDRIRVTGGNGGNYRLNPNNGAVAAIDGMLAYATTDANTGQTPGVGSSAYTNSYIGSSATTLYNLDEAASRLVRQDPPNNGTLNTVGPLGISTNGSTQASDIDIYFNPTTGQNVAYISSTTLSLATASVSNQLYTVNLTTGATTAVGTLGSATALYGVGDITLAITRPALTNITGQLAYALAGTNLLTFDTALPGTIRTATGITGVDATQTLVGLDVRPLNNALYALGYNSAAATGVNNSQLYSLDAGTGTATAVGAAFRLELGTGSVGFDFNPTVDRIRVVGANRNNYRLNPNSTAASVLAATDGPVAYTTGTNTPSIGAVAYTNSFMGASTASGTTLYNYDLALNQLNTQATANPPADGQLTAVGASGITVNTTTPYVDLDIYSTGAGVNTAYLVANTGTSLGTTLYTVNLATGAATPVGAIGNGAVAARNIAIAAATGVITSSRPAELATSLTLHPNPLASATSLSFGLPRAARVELTVTDALGRVVDQVDAGLLPAGPQALRWSRHGQAAGLYFFRLRFDGQPAGTRQAMLTE